MHKECLPDGGWRVLRKLKGLLEKHPMTLAGGTALALQLGHRISNDLDFFAAAPFKTESIISDIKKAGLSFKVIAGDEESLTLIVEDVKVSFLKYDYRFLEKPSVYEGATVSGILDIASMKLIAISQRGTKRDFIDLYFILKDIPFQKIAGHMVKRFGAERINPVHIGKSLVYFSDAESHPEPVYIKGKTVKWTAVKDFFKRHVRQFVLDLDEEIKNQ